MSQYPSNIDLSSLTGPNGFQINGVTAGDISGDSVASAGDVNGDGFADVIIGAQFADPNGTASGASYVVFGKASGFSANFDLSSLTGANGIKLSGVAAYDHSGCSVASAGDVNGDGFADLVIGATQFNAYNPLSTATGVAYVVFGKSSGFSANVDLSTLNGTNGFRIVGKTAQDFTGRSVSSAGDINGDGFADLIIGADGADPHSSYSGASYVVFGKASGFSTNLNLSALNGSNGFQISGVAFGDHSGGSVASAGDVNGDGYADLIVGAFSADANGGDAGASYVVFGKPSGFAPNLDLSTLDGTNGFKISGEVANEISGASVSSAGDVNGDGYADVFIGAPRADSNGTRSGASYVVFGKASGFAANVDLSALTGVNGFKISGNGFSEQSGDAVDSAGDVNGDGFDDLIISAIGAAPHGVGSGASYVVFGKASGFASNLDLSTLTGVDGFQISGEFAGDNSGNDVASAGDVNGDGLADLIVGASSASPHGALSGASYVVFGRASDLAVNLTGTVASQTLVGSAFNDTLLGLAGNDTLFGHGGNDLLDGGSGFDTVVFSGVRSAYTIASAGNGAPLSVAGPDGTASLSSIETLKFSDSTIAAATFPAEMNLSGLDGTNGFKINGEAASDSSGYSVSSAGDVNGDGFADVIAGAPDARPYGSGVSYVVFGKPTGFAANLNLSSLNGVNGFKISGVQDASGISVGSADVNGDGFADLIIGAHSADPHGNYSGTTYVVFGKSSGFPATVNLSNINGSNGFAINGVAAFDFSGRSVASAGDVNGDGFADVIIGALTADSHAGASYVVFGKAAGFAASVDLSSLNGSNGFKISGEAANDFSGSSVASAGDVNGDGFADLIVGAHEQDPHGAESGAAYVIFGKASGFAANLGLSSLNGSNGFKLNGVDSLDNAGCSVASAGDINGDGFADVIIGAYGADPNGSASGASYVVFGKAGGWGASLDLSSLNGTNGFKIAGESDFNRAGHAVASAGDVNGDGFTDLLVGTYGADGYAGSSYVVFGKASGWGATLQLSSLTGADGFKLDGVAAHDNSGFSVASAGDVNRDGLADLVLGAPGVDSNGAQSGASYVVFGKLSPVSVDLTGTAASQRLVGSAFGDTLLGLGGNDTLFGHGGNDVIDGGAGTDTAVFSGLRAAYTVTQGNGQLTVSGPDGVDTLSNVELLAFDDVTLDFSGGGSVSIGDASISEGNSGTKILNFTVTRTGGSAAFSVNFTTADNTATTADGDYVAASGTLDFGQSVSTKTISITVNGDTKIEPDETFFINLSGATNGTIISDNQASGTIIGDDGLTIESAGATTLFLLLNHFYLRDNNGAGPSLKLAGNDIVAGQFGAWTPIAAESTGSGYEVAWKVTGADQYSVWGTDANGNYTGNLVPGVTGNDPALVATEASFQQDINGDGQISSGRTPIETHGATTLALGGNHYYLQNNAGAGPSLKIGGNDVVAGQFGAWTPIAAETTGSGYEVAWKVTGADQYSVWSTDANGNYVANLVPGVTGSDPALLATESFFQQDINGDGQISSAHVPIETHGVTTLATGNSHFYLQDNTGAGPSLKFGGNDVTAGQFGGWTPIAAETTGSGYEVAWKVTGLNQYSVWSTDANGNYLGNLVPTVTGNDPALLTTESFFQQDLNGDGQISSAHVPIETNGVTTLASGNNHFYLQDNTGAGPSLKLGGSDVVAGQFGGWTPIAAESTGAGYEVAWKVTGLDQYSVWSTDANGNYTGNLVPSVAGNNPALTATESFFHQDLNGDGLF